MLINSYHTSESTQFLIIAAGVLTGILVISSSSYYVYEFWVGFAEYII